MNRVLFSSKTEEWSTPKWLFDSLNIKYRFNLDPCASYENHKCDRWFMKEDDGLSQEWFGNVFVNPPYGRGIGNWVKKCFEESLRGCLVVALLPARTDTKWFHDYCYHKADSIEFIKGRLRFGDSTENAPFPNMIVIWGSA